MLRRRRPADPADAETQVLRPVRGARDHVVEEELPPPRERPPMRTVWPWLLLVLGLVLAAIALVWFLTLDEGADTSPVPSVVRLLEADAVRLLESQGFEPVVRRRADDAPEGIVFDQDPAAGDELGEGETVEVLVSTGPAETTVPNVVGLEADEAEERLEDAGLTAARAGVFSEEPEGTVVAQDPAAGDEVPQGASVRINVSRGSGRVEVPDVVGQTAAEAGAALRAAGLASPRVVSVPSSEPAGTVVAQSPSAGSEVERGTAIRINVSDGSGGAPPQREVPDVVGSDEDEAVRTLEEAGFTVRIRREDTDDPAEAGLVIAQDPEGGAERREGDEVAITVGEPG